MPDSEKTETGKPMRRADPRNGWIWTLHEDRGGTVVLRCYDAEGTHLADIPDKIISYGTWITWDRQP